MNKFQENSLWVKHTNQVLEKTQDIKTLCVILQNSARGYILTQKPEYKQSITVTTAELFTGLGNLKILTSDNYKQAKAIDSLEILITQRVDHSNKLISLVDLESPQRAILLVQDGIGNSIADHISILISKMQVEENRLLHLRKIAENKSKKDFNNIAILTLTIVFLIFSFLTWQVLRSHRKALEVQNTLEQREQFLNDIINFNKTNIYVKDINGYYLLINNNIEKLTGVPKEKMEGKTDYDLFPKERADEYRNADLPVIATKKSIEVEEKMEFKDGTHYFLTTKFPMFDGQGKLYAVGSTSIDITGRKEIENIREKTNSLFENATQGIIISNTKGEIVLTNPFAEQLFGYEKDEMNGISIDQLIPHRNSEKHTYHREGFYKNLKNRKMGSEKELSALKKSGEEFSVEIGLSHFKQEDELFIISFCSDISERTKYLNDIKELSDRIQLATNSAEIGIWDWDIKNNILNWDKRMYSLYGIEEKDFSGAYEAWQKGLHPDDKVFGDNAIQKAINGEEDFDISFRVIWPDGSIHYIKAFADVFKNEQGEAIRMAGVNWDITTEKKHEEQIEEKSKELQAVNKELEGFSYSVSHDLRAPLRSISGYTNILKEDYANLLDEEGNRLMQVIIDNSNKMGKLIDGLLNFSRLGRKELSKTEINNVALVNEIVKGASHRNPDRDITWKINKLPAIKGDLEMIRQVWENYIINAVKYTGKKEKAEIEVGAISVQNEIIFYVKDNGAGFNMNYSEKLFGVFQRLHSQEEFEGTGIGLANVKKIVNKHGGRVWAEGEENNGATFYFSIPIEKL